MQEQQGNSVLGGPLPCYSLGDVLEGVASRLQQQFAELVGRTTTASVESRPQELLQFVHGTRQQLLRSAAILHDPRKLGPLAQLVAPNGVLDIAAQHARHLQTAADELFKANGELRSGRVPLFNIPSALDVLSTGTYSSLPASIQDMRGPRSLPEAQQQRLVRHLNHLLYAQLLKAHLPDCLELVQVQLEQLLRALRERMWYAADAAAVEAAKRAAAGPDADSAAAASGRTASQQQQQSAGGSSGLKGASQPAASGATGGSTVSGVSSASAAGKDASKDAGRGLHLDKYAADEITAPLRVMHGVLRDVAAQILLHEVRAAAEKLAGPGSKWEGQLKLTRAEVLTPGIRMHYWQQVPVLLAQQPAGGGSSSAAAAAAADPAAATLPAVEVGLGSDGTVQAMHLPPLRAPGSLQQAWSGRVVLRPGSAYGGELNMEMNILLRHHQEALQAKQEAARQQLLHRRPGATEQQAAITALQELAAGLTDLCSSVDL
ncbi:hypothetical protein OEZ85_003626 [Tetradesmus obliquus]|uniref:Mediator of RNA polymerase II transcription subunit 14 n=1 Tax=Tetradesmus obliquus TaxID=3088 RepID=A0ABY8UCI1_TETOB|nr:hypothetical protein OEZ85_003626 [Tetradesmus obliquus]